MIEMEDVFYYQSVTWFLGRFQNNLQLSVCCDKSHSFLKESLGEFMIIPYGEMEIHIVFIFRDFDWREGRFSRIVRLVVCWLPTYAASVFLGVIGWNFFDVTAVLWIYPLFGWLIYSPNL